MDYVTISCIFAVIALLLSICFAVALTKDWVHETIDAPLQTSISNLIINIDNVTETWLNILLNWLKLVIYRRIT